MTPHVTKKVAEFAASTDISSVDETARERIKYLILDGLACGLTGAKLPWSTKAVDVFVELEGLGSSAVWGWNINVPPSAASALNGSFIQGFELDDYHEHGPLHSSAICLPAALASAGRVTGTTGADFLMSCLVGYEIGPRLGMLMDGYRMIERGWHCGAVYGSVSGALSAGRIRRLTSEQMENAIGIAATQASGLMAAQFGAMVKRMHHGFAARNGVVGAALAEGGYTGIDAVIEAPYGALVSTFCPDDEPDWSLVVGDLGERWELLNIAIKPYAAQGGLHPTIEAILRLRDRHGIDAEAVQNITIKVPSGPYKHAGWELTYPASEVGAQMNLAYGAAVALLDGAASIKQFSPERVNSPDVWNLLERIYVNYDEKLDALSKAKQRRRLTEVVVELASGQKVTEMVEAGLGSGVRPLTNSQIEEKYYLLTREVMNSARAGTIADAVMEIDSASSVKHLVSLLSESVDSVFE